MQLHTPKSRNSGRVWSSLLIGCLMIFGISTCISSCSKSKSRFSKNEQGVYYMPIQEVSFDDSMGKSETEFRFIFANSDDTVRYTKAKALFEKNLPSKIAAGTKVKIPKIIHQIWVGPNLPPPYFADFQEKWRTIHPDWEYHLWGESELEQLNLDNWDIVEKSQNWAEKSDIIRCDLLDRFGGLYIDIDMDPLHSLNELHEKYDFYAGMEHPHKISTTPNRVWVGISIMASRPGHPILKNWKRRIRSGWDEVDLRFSSQVERVINHTYFPFTHAVMQEIDQPGNTDILFPATYFYPIAPAFAAKRRNVVRAVREKIYDILESVHLKKPRAFSKCYPETIAVHYWGNSWMPTPAEQIKETHRLVDSARKDIYRLQQRLRTLEHQLQIQSQKPVVCLCPNSNVGQDTSELPDNKLDIDGPLLDTPSLPENQHEEEMSGVGEGSF